MAVAAARSRGEAIGHVLLIGSPGSGKATLAQILANAMGVNIKSTSGRLIEKAGELAGLLTSLEKGDVLFIDEIHRLQPAIAHDLCSAMKDFTLEIIIDQGSQERPLRLNLPLFTVVGTAPQKERMSRELMSCFPIVENMSPYTGDELVVIAGQFANAFKLDVDETAYALIARSSDGTPLDVLNRLRHIRDFAHVKGFSCKVSSEIAAEGLKLLPPPESTKGSGSERQAIPSEVRREVWRRDSGMCTKCGRRENLEYDHIIPIAKGGSNTARNIELLCEVCNRSKRDSIL
jgi:Holliday junction DNA helicase RuvB